MTKEARGKKSSQDLTVEALGMNDDGYPALDTILEVRQKSLGVAANGAAVVESDKHQAFNHVQDYGEHKCLTAIPQNTAANGHLIHAPAIKKTSPLMNRNANAGINELQGNDQERFEKTTAWAKDRPDSKILTTAADPNGQPNDRDPAYGSLPRQMKSATLASTYSLLSATSSFSTPSKISLHSEGSSNLLPPNRHVSNPPTNRPNHGYSSTGNNDETQDRARNLGDVTVNGGSPIITYQYIVNYYADGRQVPTKCNQASTAFSDYTNSSQPEVVAMPSVPGYLPQGYYLLQAGPHQDVNHASSTSQPKLNRILNSKNLQSSRL